ncbi:MAG: hypothetical protein KGL35_00370 [Bradyrhizobium sp.]|nr:hypothetical protein [Bradyrhizobium sp.]
MIDRREAILARLESVLTDMPGATISGGWSVYRNKEDLTEAMQPAFVIFDAHEERDPAGETLAAPSFGYARVKMTPRVGLYAADAAENVGPILDGMRLAALAAIFADASSSAAGTLGAYLVAPGAFTYEGAGSQLDRGAEMTGELLLSIAFFYPLKPTDFS